MVGGYRLGIDLGTSFTAAAVCRDGRVEIVDLGARSSVIPSVVFAEPDGSWTVGEAADRRGMVEPERVAREFKRRFGDPVPLMIGGSPFSVEVITSVLLGRVIETVVAREGGPPATVTVTHPANWGPYKCDLLASAARLAGIDDPLLLSEPVAAARAHGAEHTMADGESLAVYDLGAGTFDAATLTRDGDDYRVREGADGIDRLGGLDLDEAVLAHVLDAVGSSPTLCRDEASSREVLRLRADCRAAKEALSEDTETVIPVHLGGVHAEVRLTRGEFEEMVRPTLDPTVALLAQTIRRAGLAPDDLEAVLLIGGSSRIPVVASMVGAGLALPATVDAHPKHAVALGAAREPMPSGAAPQSAAAPRSAAPPPAPTTATTTPPTRTVPPEPVLPPRQPTLRTAAPAGWAGDRPPPLAPRRGDRPALLAAVAAGLALLVVVGVVLVVGAGTASTPRTPPGGGPVALTPYTTYAAPTVVPWTSTWASTVAPTSSAARPTRCQGCGSSATTRAPAVESGPSFVYPSDGGSLDHGGSYMFKVSPVAGAEGYLFGLFQGGAMVWENQRNEGSLASSGEYALHPGGAGHDRIARGALEVRVRALVGGQWTDATVIDLTVG